MTQREQLELAARACGYEIALNNDIVFTIVGGDASEEWNPVINQADSDRMACKLRIETVFHGDYVYSFSRKANARLAQVKFDNTDEDVCRAVREARLLVAAEIGRLK